MISMLAAFGAAANPRPFGEEVSFKASDIALHHVRTAKGEWAIYVQRVAQSEDQRTLFLIAILEANVDKEHVLTRRLELSGPASEFTSAAGRERVMAQIRNWIEITEGDGFLLISSA
jgi:hypothetical protein